MPIKKATSIKDKIAGFKNTGQISLNSADIAEFNQPEKEEKPEEQPDKVTVTASKIASRDPIVNTPEVATTKLNETMKESEQVVSIIPEAIDDLEEITITNAEKDKFIEAIINNSRFELPFSIFNGKLRGVFRARKQKESLAILSQLRRETDSGKIQTIIEHSTRTRQFCLTCQLKEFRGARYPEFSEPMIYLAKGENETQPEWLDRVKLFDDMDDGILTAIYKQLRIFEKKYWTMIENAEDQNFWKTEGSS